MRTGRQKNDFEPHPLTPIVTIEEFLAFDPTKPETKTASPLANAVAEAFCSVKPLNGTNVTKYLEVNINKLSAALELIIGMDFKELHDVWLNDRYRKIQAENPNWSTDRIAQALGFSDRTALWRLLHRDKRKKEYHELKTWLNEYTHKR